MDFAASLFNSMPYRFALIGCGQIGRRHARLAAEFGHLVAVCDTDPVKLQEFCNLTGAPGYLTPGELLAAARPDILVICTPNYLHASQSILGMEAGCHVICEKPMALTSKDAYSLLEVSRRTGKSLYVVKQNRFNPPVMAVRELLDRHALGTLHAFQLNCFWNRDIAYFRDSPWRGSLELDGGPLFTQFSHFIDLACWFFGKPAAVLFASGRNILHPEVVEFEDEGCVVMEFENNLRGTLQYSLNAWGTNMEGSITLFGNRGTVKIGGTYLNELSHFNVAGVDKPFLPTGSKANDYGGYQGTMNNHHQVYEAVIRSLDHPDYRFMDPEEALVPVVLIERIYQMMRSKGGNGHGC